MTFLRFVPALKAKYDYGLNIFILTLSLVSLSGYREHQVLELACNRVLTVILGSFIAMIVCICIYPVWIGEDLHNLVASNMDKLGHFLQGTQFIPKICTINAICSLKVIRYLRY